MIKQTSFASSVDTQFRIVTVSARHIHSQSPDVPIFSHDILKGLTYPPALARGIVLWHEMPQIYTKLSLRQKAKIEEWVDLH